MAATKTWRCASEDCCQSSNRMVPGMSERKRLATEMQRLEWLADAVRGSSRHPAGPMVPLGSRYDLLVGLCRRGIAMALGLGRRTCRRSLRLIRPPPKRAADNVIA
jgi:hypothetical protein